jgi:hypothetical protein
MLHTGLGYKIKGKTNDSDFELHLQTGPTKKIIEYHEVVKTIRPFDSTLSKHKNH